MIAKPAILFPMILWFTAALGQSPARDSRSNLLIHESSPYLLQHARNPVNWFPWGPKALKKAGEEGKMMIVSVGYAACHWCHVMERETFSDTTVANLMNRHFISVKVDREERPDVDQAYMDVLQLVTGQGGWPLNAFTLPDGRAFHAGTYFTREQWLDLLGTIVQTYDNDREKVLSQASSLTAGIQAQEMFPASPTGEPGVSSKDYQSLLASWQSFMDDEWGGYDRVTKFPLPSTWEAMLQHYYLTGDTMSLRSVTTTLDHMAMGGIYDHLNGGFARYSTDHFWRVPHFEKMLYDNGQLVSLYAHAYQLTGKPRYAEVIRETLRFVASALTNKEGGFFSSLNADSEGEEGKYYVWTQEEIDRVLDPASATMINDYYHIKPSGNWEKRKNILYTNLSKEEFASENNVSLAEFERVLDAAHGSLRKVQQKRKRPSTDDKILTSWNAIMLKGYVDAFRALGEPSYLASALRSATFLEKRMLRPDGGLWRNFKDGKVSIPGFLDDYALLADAYIELYQVTFDIRWLTLAGKLTDFAIAHFKDPQSGLFFFTSDQADGVVVRQIETLDNAIPSSNSVMASNLYRLGSYHYDQAELTASSSMIARMRENIFSQSILYTNWVQLLGIHITGPYEIAIVGKDHQKTTSELQRHYLPTSFFSGGKTENLPLLEMKLVKGRTTIYVCRNKVCKQPVTSVMEALRLIAPGRQEN